MCELGRDPRYVCWKSSSKSDVGGLLSGANAAGGVGGGPGGVNSGAGVGVNGGEASSDEEDDEEDDPGGGGGAASQDEATGAEAGPSAAPPPVPPSAPVAAMNNETGSEDAVMAEAGALDPAGPNAPANGDDQPGLVNVEGPAENAAAPASSGGDKSGSAAAAPTSKTAAGKEPVPLVDYVLNVMKFVDAILSNNSTDDHCREFVRQDGLVPLMNILGLPNLPVDFPGQAACQAVAGVCKSILNLAHEPRVLEVGLANLNEVLKRLEPLHEPIGPPGSSVLLRELVNAPANLTEAVSNPGATPLLHSMCAAHAYITMFVHVCRTGQSDIRTISVAHWGSELGLEVLDRLARLYTSLVWESTVLLALFSEDALPPDCQFGRADMDRLLELQGLGTTAEPAPAIVGAPTVSSGLRAHGGGGQPATGPTTDNSPSSPASGGSMDSGSGHVTTAMEQLTTVETSTAAAVVASNPDAVANVPPPATMEMMDVSPSPASESGAQPAVQPTPQPGTSSDDKKCTGGTGTVSSTNSFQLQAQIKQIKPLLTGSSRLGRALTELFGLLVKLCVGSPMRHRRGQQVPPGPVMPSAPARAVAAALAKLLDAGLAWEPPIVAKPTPLPKFRLTFLICSVGFATPMLFDEKKYPYHLMLMKFLACGGQEAFFESFRWAVTMNGTVSPGDGLEHPGLPDGTGEFLDAWLLLLEKMVNPKTVLESPHALPNKNTAPLYHHNKSSPAATKPFDPLRYLIVTHKTAFEAVMQIWGKRPLAGYGARMSESVLTILCHILRGETVIKERLEKEKPAPDENKEGGAVPSSSSTTATAGAPTTSAAGGGAAAAGTPADGAGTEAAAGGGSPASSRWVGSTPAEPEINAEYLQTLCDMGFPRER